MSSIFLPKCLTWCHQSQTAAALRSRRRWEEGQSECATENEREFIVSTNALVWPVTCINTDGCLPLYWYVLFCNSCPTYYVKHNLALCLEQDAINGSKIQTDPPVHYDPISAIPAHLPLFKPSPAYLVKTVSLAHAVRGKKSKSGHPKLGTTSMILNRSGLSKCYNIIAC